MRRLIAITTIAIITPILNCDFLPIKNGEPDKLIFSSTGVTDTTDLHFTGKYCTECHEEAPKKGEDLLLKFQGDFTQLCKCHYDPRRRCLHPVDIEPSDELKARLPADLPLQDGKVSCSTCHDIYLQCREPTTDHKALLEANMFLRGAPFSRRTAFCFRCHDKERYKMINPHNQIDQNGSIIEAMCLYCHIEKPDEKDTTLKDLKLTGSLENVCSGCHQSGGTQSMGAVATHMGKPSPGVVATMNRMQDELGIILPLNEKGELTCVTCHNPHDKGVIPPEKAAAKGAGEKFLHRAPDQMCILCH